MLLNVQRPASLVRCGGHVVGASCAFDVNRVAVDELIAEIEVQIRRPWTCISEVLAPLAKIREWNADPSQPLTAAARQARDLFQKAELFGVQNARWRA